jgi:hypothetical protein
MQDGRRKHANEEHDKIGRREMRVQFYGGTWIFEDYTGLLQSNECNEKPDTRRNTIFQARADCVENQFA